MASNQDISLIVRQNARAYAAAVAVGDSTGAETIRERYMRWIRINFPSDMREGLVLLFDLAVVGASDG